jgi:hypothetical protein
VITSTGAAERLIVRVEAGRDLVPAEVEGHRRI